MSAKLMASTPRATVMSTPSPGRPGVEEGSVPDDLTAHLATMRAGQKRKRSLMRLLDRHGL
ncbi:hypothetical protein ACWC9U_36630 [Streptomyces sp. 900116325]|uniref:hypothetical protein n=1 Tax=Streptomyces sp. NPDC056333 TaxID=3345786 RepID=UPI0035E25DF5